GDVRNALAGGASTIYPLAVAHLELANGADVTNVMSVVQQGVQQDQQRVDGDVKALGANNAQLLWLIQNVGPTMTGTQLTAAIESYESQPDWSKQNQKLFQQLQTDSDDLLQNMAALSNLAQSDPDLAQTLGVNGTITGVMNDSQANYGIAMAASQKPLVFNSDQNGKAFLNLLSSLKLADQGRKTAQLLGSLYVRNLVTNALKNNVDWAGSSDPLSDAQAVIDALKSPGLSNWMGVNDETVWNSAVGIVEKYMPSPDLTPAEAQQQ